MIEIPRDTQVSLQKIAWRFCHDNAERIEKLCRIWNHPPTELLEWVLWEGLEQLEAYTGLMMLNQEVPA